MGIVIITTIGVFSIGFLFGTFHGWGISRKNLKMLKHKIEARIEDLGDVCVYEDGSLSAYDECLDMVKDLLDEKEEIHEHGITMDTSKLHPSPDLIKSATTFAELNRKLKVVSEALSNIIEHENYDFGYSEAADIAEEVIKNDKQRET